MPGENIMTDNYSAFRTDIGKFTDMVEGKMQSFVQEFCFDLAKEVIQATPIDTGFCRANWTAYLNSEYIDANLPEKGTQDQTWPEASAVLSSMAFTLASALPGDTIHLVNNCSYVLILEDGGLDDRGNMRSARNFVKMALAQTDEIAHRVIARITK
jgi:hypothetical protein